MRHRLLTPLFLLISCLALALASPVQADDTPPEDPITEDLELGASSPAPSHPELGAVAWLRSHRRAFDRARAEQKPVFILFQEVPG